LTTENPPLLLIGFTRLNTFLHLKMENYHLLQRLALLKAQGSTTSSSSQLCQSNTVSRPNQIYSSSHGLADKSNPHLAMPGTLELSGQLLDGSFDYTLPGPPYASNSHSSASVPPSTDDETSEDDFKSKKVMIWLVLLSSPSSLRSDFSKSLKSHRHWISTYASHAVARTRLSGER
jgi:hypothetical protein